MKFDLTKKELDNGNLVFVQTWQDDNLPNWVHTHNRVSHDNNGNLVWEAICHNGQSAVGCGFGGTVEGEIHFQGFVDIEV